MTQFECTCTTYIAAPASDVWDTLTDADSTGQWWEHRNVSDWKVGSEWHHLALDGSNDGTGEVLESQEPSILAFTFPPAGDSRVRFQLDDLDGITRLTMQHVDLPNEHMVTVVAAVWPAVLSNLKTTLEAGAVMGRSPLPAALASIN
jgi:uncharacterized protein YndB with AHSA1/START domain